MYKPTKAYGSKKEKNFSQYAFQNNHLIRYRKKYKK